MNPSDLPGPPGRRRPPPAARAATDCVVIGLERCLDEPPAVLRHADFGLLSNQASVDRWFDYAHTLLAGRFPGRLKALFGPQHGMWSAQQDNMVETPHGHHAGLPVFSLYADRRRPSPEMLAGLDCLVIDLQDVGTRVYTFIWTVSYCLEACAEVGIPVLVLDRPNPLGGTTIEGPTLDERFQSFVGRHAIPMRHGLTIAEMALYLNQSMDIGADVHVVLMEGWNRAMHWTDTGRVWIGPSPNLSRIEGVDVYPGQVLVEGTNLSEGRGTTTPFEVFGAPFIEPERLLAALDPFNLDGVILRPVRFAPTFQKWHGRGCRGLFLHVVDRQVFSPYRTTLAVLACVARLWPDAFAWRQPPYEYERETMPIDLLTGGATLREAIARGAAPAAIAALAATDEAPWRAQVGPHLCYD